LFKHAKKILRADSRGCKYLIQNDKYGYQNVRIPYTITNLHNILMSHDSVIFRNYLNKIKASKNQKMYQIKITGTEFDSFYTPMGKRLWTRLRPWGEKVSLSKL